MIQTKYGDLLESKGMICHGCNSRGVMGSGVALQIRNKWPHVYEEYRNALISYQNLGLDPMGKVIMVGVGSDAVVANIITQRNYGRDKNKVYVDYDAVIKGFKTLNHHLKARPLTVNFPLIGCGLAGGDWRIISDIIDEELDDKLEKILWLRGEYDLHK